MRIPAIVLNVGLLLYIAFILAKHGVPRGEELFFVALFTIVPIVSIFALLNVGGDDWISLYFRRKALEERRKIDDLNAHRKS